MLIVISILFFTFKGEGVLLPILNFNGTLPDKHVVDYIISITGFFLTALGFLFVVLQVSALTKQVNNQEQQYHKDSEFKNFLEATKILTSAENENNMIAQISAMFLLYDFAKNYPKNIEKVIQVLNRFPTPFFYPEIQCKDKRVISEWKENGSPDEQVASVALELIKKLFAYAIENKCAINLSGVILFNFDIDVDVKTKTHIKLSDISTKLDKTIFLLCNFSNNVSSKKKIYFSTAKKSVIQTYSVSNTGKLDISLSTFVSCDLTYCDFSYSNLWGSQFEKCILTKTQFNQAECEGVDVINSEITVDQIKSMLFISRNEGDFFEFSEECTREQQLEYGIIYDKNPACFKDWDEYNEFKSKKFKNKKQEQKITKNTLTKIKQFLCRKICNNIDV